MLCVQHSPSCLARKLESSMRHFMKRGQILNAAKARPSSLSPNLTTTHPSSFGGFSLVVIGKESKASEILAKGFQNGAIKTPSPPPTPAPIPVPALMPVPVATSLSVLATPKHDSRSQTVVTSAQKSEPRQLRLAGLRRLGISGELLPPINPNPNVV